MKYNNGGLLGYGLLFLICAFIATFALVLNGVNSGRKEACQSVQLVWIKDKCTNVLKEPT